MSRAVSIPRQVIDDLKMVAAERSTLVALYAHAQRDGTVQLGANEIGELTGQSGFTVRRHCARLEQLGYVTRWNAYRGRFLVHQYQLTLRASGSAYAGA